jgi:hypothetical protein
MKFLSLAIFTTWILSVGGVCVAVEPREDHARGRALKNCDPICELRSQDTAFAMLIEAFREFQSHQIQTDFDQRLRAIAGIGEERGSLIIQTKLQGVQTFRFLVEELAKKERDLRMERLQTQVANFHTAYGCMRRVDEEEIGELVAKRVDTKAAAAKLRTFSIVALGSPATADYRVVKAVPASAVFLDAPSVKVSSERLAEPCD